MSDVLAYRRHGFRGRLQSFGQEGMGPAFKNDPKDPKKLFYLDAFDYRRRRPKAELAGCCSITMYLRKELKAAGHPEGNFRDQLMLAVRGWRLIDRIRVKSLNR